MSQENVEILRKLQNDWNRGERDLAGAYHPDVEFLPRRAATEGGYFGLSGIEAFIADTSEVFDKYEMNFEFTDLGERVLAFGTIHVRAKGSGVETDIQTGGLFEFQDGRIVRWEDFGSKSKALEAAGCRSSALDESSSLNSCVSERSDRRPDSSLATTVPGSARPIDTQVGDSRPRLRVRSSCVPASRGRHHKSGAPGPLDGEELMASHDRAESYINRLLEDRELQNDLRELLAAFRGSFDRAAAGRRKPTRLLENRKFQQQTQRAVASPRGGSARLRGESPNDYQGRRIVGLLLAVGGVALAVREVLREPGPDAPWG